MSGAPQPAGDTRLRYAAGEESGLFVDEHNATKGSGGAATATAEAAGLPAAGATVDGTGGEREKWEHYYAGIALESEHPAQLASNEEFADIVASLLPDGGRILEAGCGGGWQSLALARRGKWEVHLLDFAQNALDYAKRLFDREQVAAKFILGDVFTPGAGEYDLVFNFGVLEHYTLEQQAEFLRGMKSRSRRYVMAVVPNRLCYWYWIGRTAQAAAGGWPFGKESPQTNLTEPCARAGLHVRGHAFLASAWVEQIIDNIGGVTPGLREVIKTVHRSPLLPAESRSYLTAVLSSVQPEAGDPPRAFRTKAEPEATQVPELTGALSDALALRIAAETQNAESRAAIARLEAALQSVASGQAVLSRLASEQAALRSSTEQIATQSAKAHEAILSLRSEAIERVVQERNELQRRLDAQDGERAALQASVADFERRLEEKEHEAHRIWRSYQIEKSRADAAEGREAAAAQNARVAQQRADELSAALAELSDRLHSITNGTGWRVLQAMYRVRYFLFPRGSMRERAARWAMHKQRRFRYYARQGPGALLAAVGRQFGIGRRPAPGEALAPRPLDIAPVRADEITISTGVPGLVSVILPVFNQADMLAESIESVLAQTYPDFELIVLDDGSRDGIDPVLSRYVGHPKVRVLRQVNQKLPKALSNAFEFARGEFLSWTSADNIMGPRQLERQVEFLRANPDTEMVYCDYLAIDDRGEPLRDPNFRPHNRRQPDDPEIHVPRDPAPINEIDDNFIGACFMYRGWVGKAIGEYAPQLGVEDYDYWMRINRLFRIRHIGTDETLYQYRVHDNTLCARAVEHRIAERLARLMKYEKDRAAAYAQPWTIYVDERSRGWMASLPLGAHRIAPLEARAAAPADEKAMVIAHASSLATVARGASPEVPSCVWFDADPRVPHALGPHLQKIDFVFAPDQATLDRLRIYTDRALLGAPGHAMLRAMVGAADNVRFYRATTPAADRARVLPQAFVPPDRRVRVLLQVDHFLHGGVEGVVLDLVRVLDPNRFEVSLLAFGREGAAVEEARAMGVPYTHLGRPDRERAYREFLRNGKFDVINAHSAPWGANIASELGIPFVQTIHNSYVWLDDEQLKLHRHAAQHTRAFTAVSGEAGAYADLRLGFDPNRLVITPNGVNTAALQAVPTAEERAAERRKLGFAADDFVFLNVASLFPPKAHHLLIPAVAKARQRNRRIKVALLGRALDEAYARRIHRLVDELGLRDSVIFLGYDPQPHKYYRVCDAFVLPSFVEGWSLALAEAIYAGLPIIASSVGSAADLLTRTGGRLIRAPGGPTIDLDMHRFYATLEQDHADFVNELADALVATAADPQPPKLTPQMRQSFDRDVAYQAYARLLPWIAFGGEPAAGRAWVWALHGFGAAAAGADA